MRRLSLTRGNRGTETPRRQLLTQLWCALLVCAIAVPVGAQDMSLERITFDEAITRAVTRNPTIRQAAAGILRAEGVLQQASAAARPTLDASVRTNVIGPVPEFSGQSIVPRTQLSSQIVLAAPLLTPVRWAQRTQAADQVTVSERVTDDVRKAIAVATAQTYLAVITQRRVLDVNQRARDNAKAHFDFAQQRFQGGVGSRLNALRAQQELSSDEARVEEAQLGVRRAQEALGVLIAAEGPVDAASEPVFQVPSDIPLAAPGVTSAVFTDWLTTRSDIRLLNQRIVAAERVVKDSRLDYLPFVTGLFTPQMLAPPGLFAPARSWSAGVLFTFPVFEAGTRKGLARQRQSALDVVQAELSQSEREARSEARTALEAMRSTERSLASARSAAQQANEVVSITDLAFRAGATTNIEVIDAQRRARDAESAAAVAEDANRRARLEWLVATGKFPN